MGTPLYERYLAEQQPGAASDPTHPPQTALYQQYVASQQAPAAPARGNEKLHAEYRTGALGRRMARENAADREALDSEPGYGERLATHLLNTAQGIPGMEAVEAGAGALGSRLTSHPLSYRQSLSTLRDNTSQIGGTADFAEKLMGGLAVAPFLPKGVVRGGAAYGAADAALSGDPLGEEGIRDRAGHAAVNAAGGAIAGRFLHDVGAPVIRGTSRLASRVLPERAGQFITRLTGAAPTGAEAESREMLRSALLNGGVSPGAAAATVPMDQPTSMMELGSRSVPALVRAARNVPTSTAGQTTDRFLTERAAGTGKRIERALTQATGHTATDTFLPIEELIAKRSAEAKPLYDKAYAYGEIKDPQTVAEIQRLLQEPVFAKAWHRGQALARIEGSTVPEAPPRGMSTADFNAIQQDGPDRFVPNSPTSQGNPTVRQINRWKKGLDATINSGYGSENALSKDEARVYRQALNGVLERVDEEVPAFKQARANFRGHSEMAEAAESGAKHFSPSTPTGALERQLATLPANEREAYTNNALNKLVEQVRRAASNPDLPEAGRGTNIVQRIMGTEDAGQRLGMLFPDEQGFQTFLKRMEDEALYPKTNAFMRGQSSTNEQSAESNTPVRTWMDLARSPFSGHARARLVMRAAEGTLGKEPKLSTEQANAVGRHATATGMRLKQILMQMDADHAARELGRKRLNTALRGGLIGGEGVSNESRRRFWNDDQPHPDIPRR